MRWKVNKPRVVDEIVEGEVIIIDTETGSYYSLTGSAAWLWTGISGGENADKLIEEIQVSAQSENGGTLRQWVTEFTENLAREELLLPAGKDSPPADKNRSKMDIPHPFEKPVYEKFEDMQEYLLADPIHEVDDIGWPHPKDTGNPETEKKSP